MRALITGGAGFIGAAVARALAAAGHDLVLAGTSSTEDPLTSTRLAAIGAFDLAVHCAGGSSVAASIRDPEGDYAKTVPPFEALLSSAKGARVVLISSAAVYGAATQIPTPESAPLEPVSPYGRHKQACEDLCRTSGVATAIVRLFSIYGRDLRKQLLWDACAKARRGDVTFAGTGDEERDFLHVEDAAALIAAVADHASPLAPIFNGAAGVGTPVREVVSAITRALGAGEPRFTGVTRAGDPKRYVADIARARSIGWSPRIALVDGLADYVAWFQTQS